MDINDILHRERKRFFNDRSIKMADGNLWSPQDFVAHYLSGPSGDPYRDEKMKELRERRMSVTVDMDWFMSDGPGRYLTLKHFPKVVDLFHTDHQKADGVYPVTELLKAKEDRQAYVRNYTADPFNTNYRSRLYVFGTSPFELKEADVVIRDGRVTEIRNPVAKPLWDNFDYDRSGRDKVIDALKEREEKLIDPYEKGQQFLIAFSSGRGKQLSPIATRDVAGLRRRPQPAVAEPTSP